MPQKISLEEFGDMLHGLYGASAAQMVAGGGLNIEELREKLGLVFARDAQGNLDIERHL